MTTDPDTINALQEHPGYPHIDRWEPAPMPPDWQPDNDTPSIWSYP